MERLTNETSRVKTEINGQLVKSKVFIYDNQKRIIKTKQFFYDENGNTKNSIEYIFGEDGKIITRNEFCYDENELIIKCVSCIYSNSLFRKGRYTGG